MSFRNSSFISQIPPVTKNLILINFIIWLAMVIFPGQIGAKMHQYCALYYWESPDFMVFQPFTYMFLHDTESIAHLFFNMFSLFMFGTAVERLFGSWRYLFFYLTCGIGAALVQEGVYSLMLIKYHNLFTPEMYHEIVTQGHQALQNGMNFIDPASANLNSLVNIPSVGASGAIYGILLAFGMLFPNRPIYLFFFPMPIKAKYMVIIWGVMELAFGLAGSSDGVAHFCHLGGMLFGLLIILYWRHKKIISGPYY